MLRALTLEEVASVSGGMMEDVDSFDDGSGGGGGGDFGDGGDLDGSGASSAAPQLSENFGNLLNDTTVSSGSNTSTQSYACQTSNDLQLSGQSAAVFGGVVAAVGLLTGPGESAAAPIGGAIALAGSAVAGAGYLIGKAGGCN